MSIAPATRLRRVIAVVIRSDPLQNQSALTDSADTVIAPLAGHRRRVPASEHPGNHHINPHAAV